jgi:hypothetical protein
MASPTSKPLSLGLDASQKNWGPSPMFAKIPDPPVGSGTNSDPFGYGNFGGAGQPSSGNYGGGAGSTGCFPPGPNTDPRLASRSWPTLKVNVDSLPNGQWKEIEVDRPTIITPSCARITKPIFYHPDRISDCVTISSGVSTPAASTTTAPSDQYLQSVRHGVCYLSGPGKWWLYNSMSFVCPIWVIDASDPNVAARMLNEPGSSGVTNTGNGAFTNVVVTTSDGLLLQGNRARGAVILQHTSRDNADAANTADVYIAFEATAALGAGMYLGGGQTIALQNEICFRGNLRAICRATTVKVAITEFIT